MPHVQLIVKGGKVRFFRAVWVLVRPRANACVAFCGECVPLAPPNAPTAHEQVVDGTGEAAFSWSLRSGLTPQRATLRPRPSTHPASWSPLAGSTSIHMCVTALRGRATDMAPCPAAL